MRRISLLAKGLGAVAWAAYGMTFGACVASAADKPAATGDAPAVFAPLDWGAVKPGGLAHKQMEQAVRELLEARGALSALLDARATADAAKEPPVDVLLDLTEALTHYAYFQSRPMPGKAPQWRNAVGDSLDRIHNMKQEYAPAREDARLAFSRRGERWIGPRIGMVSSKFREQFHLLGCDASSLRADEKGVAGGFRLTSARGDFRYDMHFSGEHCGCHLPEFRTHRLYGQRFFPDWWGGPRERMRPWDQPFSLQAGQRRGWILQAAFLPAQEPPAGSPAKRTEIYAWVDDGRILRGYVCALGKDPEPVVSLSGWTIKDNVLDAAIEVGFGPRKQTYRLRGALPQSDAGPFSGQFRVAADGSDSEGRWTGILYRAFAGTYRTKSFDGEWTREALAGVAPAPPRPTQWPPAPPDAAASPSNLFAKGVELYRHVTALDWALREYPLPLADALRDVREGTDDRWNCWHCGSWDFGTSIKRSPAVPEHLHLVLAASAGDGAAGAAAYLEGLARIAQRALADRKAGAAPTVGVPDLGDPDFGPYAGLAKRMEQDPARGNMLPAAGPNQDWRLVGDWTCFGFIPRAYSFESAPYLPEVLVERGLRAQSRPLEAGRPVRITHPDPEEHIWCWRAEPDASEGDVTIPIECLRQEGVLREIWRPERDPRLLDNVYGQWATWYATTVLHADRAVRAWVAVKTHWDGRLWLNGSLVWRPARLHTPHRVAVIPVDLAAGPNRLTVCCSARPTSDGNSGKHGPWVFKYAERAFGSFAVWVSRQGEPRKADAVAAAAESERAGDRRRAAAVAARGIRGRRGDGNGRYPDARPPVAWDIEKNVNVRWKTALPTDDAEPVIVGNRLFVTTFTGELACLDASSGAVSWRKIPLVEGAGAERPPYPPEPIGASYRSSLNWRWPKGNPHQKPPGNRSALERSCLTPLADARRVWMHDPRGRVACFDHQGVQQWARAVPAQVPRFAEGGYVATRLVPPTPPAIVGSRLVAAVGEGLAAFDLDKGTPCWQRSKLDYLGQFAVMDLGGGPKEQLVLLSSGEALDAATGETLVPRCAPRVSDSACQPLVEGRVAYFHAASSAVRFWIAEDGGLCHRLLWDSPTDIRKRQADTNHGNFNGKNTPDFFCQGAYPPTPVIHNGLIFTHLAEPCSISHGPQNSTRMQTYDAATGCAVAQRYCIQINAMRPATSTVIAGGMVFCADEGGQMPYGYRNHPQGLPMISVLTAEEQPRRIVSNQPGLATLAPPVFDGRRMYLAGSEQVVCIERPEALGDRFSEYELDVLKREFFAKEVGEKPDLADEPVVPRALERLPDGLRTPVVPLRPGAFPHKLLGAWPLKDGAANDPYALMAGQSGQVVVEGTAIAPGGDPVKFRPVPDEAFAVQAGDPTRGGKGITDYVTFNVPQPAAAFDLSPKTVFGDALPARGFFFAVLANRRSMTVDMDRPENVRCWISAREINKGDRFRLTPGLYPLLIECRVTTQTAKTPVAPVFREVADPSIERERWFARVRSNADLLRAIAASGPGGAYARSALDTLGQTQGRIAPQ